MYFKYFILFHKILYYTVLLFSCRVMYFYYVQLSKLDNKEIWIWIYDQCFPVSWMFWKCTCQQSIYKMARIATAVIEKLNLFQALGMCCLEGGCMNMISKMIRKIIFLQVIWILHCAGKSDDVNVMKGRVYNRHWPIPLTFMTFLCSKCT